MSERKIRESTWINNTILEHHRLTLEFFYKSRKSCYRKTATIPQDHKTRIQTTMYLIEDRYS